MRTRLKKDPELADTAKSFRFNKKLYAEKTYQKEPALQIDPITSKLQNKNEVPKKFNRLFMANNFELLKKGSIKPG